MRNILYYYQVCNTIIIVVIIEYTEFYFSVLFYRFRFKSLQWIRSGNLIQTENIWRTKHKSNIKYGMTLMTFWMNNENSKSTVASNIKSCCKKTFRMLLLYMTFMIYSWFMIFPLNFHLPQFHFLIARRRWWWQHMKLSFMSFLFLFLPLAQGTRWLGQQVNIDKQNKNLLSEIETDACHEKNMSKRIEEIPLLWFPAVRIACTHAQHMLRKN